MISKRYIVSRIHETGSQSFLYHSLVMEERQLKKFYLLEWGMLSEKSKRVNQLSPDKVPACLRKFLKWINFHSKSATSSEKTN